MGRKRIHASNADRQRAYRRRHRPSNPRCRRCGRPIQPAGNERYCAHSLIISIEKGDYHYPERRCPWEEVWAEYTKWAVGRREYLRLRYCRVSGPVTVAAEAAPHRLDLSDAERQKVIDYVTKREHVQHMALLEYERNAGIHGAPGAPRGPFDHLSYPEAGNRL